MAIFLLALLLVASVVPASRDGKDGVSAVEAVLVGELERAWPRLQAREHAPHYLALAVEDRRTVVVSAKAGTLALYDARRERLLDVDIRVGTPELDSTHPLRGMSALSADDRSRLVVPLDCEPVFPPLGAGPLLPASGAEIEPCAEGVAPTRARNALHEAIWRELDDRYRAAAERIVMIEANQVVKVEEETLAPDFEPRSPVVARPWEPHALPDLERWAERLQILSRRLDRSPRVEDSAARMRVREVRKTFVDSEGTRLSHGGLYVTIGLQAAATAADGDQLEVVRSLSFRSAEDLPSSERLEALADEVRDRLERSLDAPRGEPYSGPVLLTGRAAAVFLHEIVGHRVEGHRQKLDHEGKTFADYVGRRILPETIHIWDDPRVRSIGGIDLNGWYRFDDEGVPAMRATVVQDGVFEGFLMGRSPLPRFPHSNGHGRRSPGNPPLSRMANTVLESEHGVSWEQLRAELVERARHEGLSYGMMVEDIEGGFTMTGRYLPNAFNVRATATWRVHVDGSPDTFVRGIDLVGTPLIAFSNLVATGDEPAVFNGTCGAESGPVPVAAVSPPLLFGRLEFQRKEKGQERPPLLARPERQQAGDASPASPSGGSR